MVLPDSFKDQMQGLLGEAYQDFIDSYASGRHYGLRLNQLKRAKVSGHMTVAQVPWCSDGYYYKEEHRPAKEAYYSAGCYYIQEPSAMTPGAALGARPGDKVIDLCAAPGGKTTQVASDMANEGLIVTNDISASRVKNLNKNVQISGIRNALVISEDPTKLAVRWPEVFDRVLVDAPCSGEGMFRKEPKLVASWEDKGPEDFLNVQRQILTSAYDLLRPGGFMVYSTCTYNMEENEGNIHWLLDTYPECHLEPLAELLKIDHGFAYEGDLRTEACARVWPHRHEGEGHFVAKIIKGQPNEDDTASIESYKLKPVIDKKALEAVKGFCDEVGIDSKVIELDRLNRVKDTIYLLPEEALDNKGLRTFANGWLIGTMKRDRFEPSQAFASGLCEGDLTKVVSFANDSEEIRRYLKGETIAADVSNGWHLVAVEGCGLGWCKAVKGRLKNKLEPSWRWQ